MGWCYFPGHGVFKMARNVVELESEIKAYIHKATEQQAWVTDFNVRRNYSTPFRIDEQMEEFPQHMNSVLNVIKSAQSNMETIFDK